MNAYVYVANDPVNNSDPTGEGPLSCTQCAYYSKKCAESGENCKRAVEEAAKKTGLCVDEKNLYQNCFQLQPDCTDMLNYCSKCGAWTK